jgi:hypothetical protein
LFYEQKRRKIASTYIRRCKGALHAFKSTSTSEVCGDVEKPSWCAQELEAPTKLSAFPQTHHAHLLFILSGLGFKQVRAPIVDFFKAPDSQILLPSIYIF